MNSFEGTFDGAPRSGRILAYASDRLIYDDYRLQNAAIVLRSCDVLELDGIYELHLFDADTEFRAVYQNGKWSTFLVSAQDETLEDLDHFFFSETQFVAKRYQINGPDEKIVVNNHFSFDEKGFLRLSGYRLAMEK